MAFSAIKRTTEAVTGDKNTNKYVATCFEVPSLTSATVTLTASDVIKQCIFEFDAYATQGGCMRDGKIYYAFGFGGKYAFEGYIADWLERRKTK